MKRKTAALILLAIAVVGIGRLWYEAKDGFSVNRIRASHLPQAGAEETLPPFLGRPWRYLARGRQCYAFASEDGEYVLKIPRCDLFVLPLKWRMFSSQRGEEIQQDRSCREAFLVESFRIAAEEFRELSAIVYSHLRTTSRLPSIRLIDNMGRSWNIDPNRLMFVVQKKEPLMMPRLLAVWKSNRKEAEEMLASFVATLDARSRLGILNKDPSFWKNFGWGDGAAHQIDIGSFYREEGKSAYPASLHESAAPIHFWLKENAPELLLLFENLLQRKLCTASSL